MGDNGPPPAAVAALSAEQRHLAEAICHAVKAEFHSALQEHGSRHAGAAICPRCRESEKSMAELQSQLHASREALARSEGRFDGCQVDLRMYMDKLDEARFERKTMQQQLDKANADLASVRRDLHLASVKLEKQSGKVKKEKTAFRDLIDRLELASKACKPNGQQKPRAAEMKRLEEDLVFMTTEGMLAPLVEALLSGSPAVKEAAAHALAQHLRWAGESACLGSAQMVLSSGATHVLVKMLNVKDAGLGAAGAAVVALDLLATGHADSCAAIAGDGAIALLVELLRSGSKQAKEPPVRLLLRLCTADPKHSAAVGLAGGIGDLLAMISLPSALEQRALCLDACELLCRMAAANHLSKGAIAEAGGLAPLVELLNSGEPELACAAAQVLGPVADAADACAELLDASIVAPLASMLTSSRVAHSEAAALALANLAAGTGGNKEAADAMLEPAVLETVVQALVTCSSPHTLRSCAAMLGHLAELGAEARARIVQANGAQALAQAAKVLAPRAAKDPDPSLPPGHKSQALLAAAAAAAHALGALFADDSTRESILSTSPGLTATLLHLVNARCGTPEAVQVATMIGTSLAESHPQEVVDAGAMAALSAMLTSGVKPNQRAAAVVLAQLDAALPDSVPTEHATLGEKMEEEDRALVSQRLEFTGCAIPALVAALGSLGEDWKEKAAVAAGHALLTTLSQLLQHESDAQLVADAGGITLLAHVLGSRNTLMATAASVLVLLFELLPQQHEHMLEIMPKLLELLVDERPADLELAIMKIAHSGCKFADCVRLIAVCGGVTMLLARLKAEYSEEIRVVACQTLADLMRQAEDPQVGQPLVEDASLALLNDLLVVQLPGIRAASAKLLWQLAYRNFNANIVASGSVPLLLKMLGDEHIEAVYNAVEAILNLTDESTRPSIVAAGAIESLIPLLRCPSLDVILAATTALDTLAVEQESIEAIAELGGVQMLVDLLKTDDSATGQDICYHAAFALAKAASNMTVKQLIMDVGGVDKIVMLVNEAVGTLSEFALQDESVEGTLGESGTIHIVRSHSSKEPVWGAAIHVLQSLAQGWAAIQNLMFATGMVQQLTHLLRHGGSSLQEAVAGVMVSLTEDGEGEEAAARAAGHKKALLELDAVEPLVAMLINEGSSGREKDLAATALAQFSSEPSVRLMLRDMGGIGSLVTMLTAQPQDDEQRSAALALLCELAQYEDAMAFILSAGAIPTLIAMLPGPALFAEKAAETLYLLAGDYACCSEIEREGGAGTLLDLLCAGEGGSISAGLAIVKLAGHPDVGPKLCTVPVITKLKDQMSIHAKDHPVQSTCALTLLGLSEHVDKHNELIHSGVVPLLVDSLKNGSDVEVMELAALTLVRIAATKLGRAEIRAAGATDAVCTMMQSASEESLRVNAALVVCNLVLDSAARDVMLESLDGICVALLNLLPQMEEHSKDGSVAAGDTLLRLLDGEDLMAAERKYGVLSSLVGLLTDKSKTLQQVAGGCLYTFCEEEAVRDRVISLGLAPLVGALVDALHQARETPGVFASMANQLAARWDGFREQFDSTWVPAEDIHIVSPIAAADMLQQLLLHEDPACVSMVSDMGGIVVLLELLCVPLADCPELNRCHILDTLSKLAKGPGFCTTIMAAQGVVMLTEMLSDARNWELFSSSDGSRQIPEMAGLFLWQLSVCNVATFVTEFGGAGGIEVVDHLLGTDSLKLKKIALELLGLLVSTPHSNRSDVFRHLGIYQHLLAAVQPGTKSSQLRLLAISVLRRLAKDKDGCDEIAAAEVIPVLAALLDAGDAQTRSESAQALGQIAVLQATAVYISGAMEKLAFLLGDDSEQVRTAAANALRPLAADDKARSGLTAEVPVLIALVNNTSSNCREAAIQMLQSLAEHEDFRALIANEGGLQALAQVLNIDDSPSATQDKLAAANALQSLVFDSPEHVKTLVDMGVHHQLLKMLGESVEHEDITSQAAAGVALLNLAQVEEEVRTELAEVHGAMDVIVGVLDEACKDGEEGNKAMEAQEAAAGLISMFAEDDDEMADFIGQTDNTIESLVQLLSTDNIGARRAAAWALRHLASSDANRAAMAQAGAIVPLVHLLEIPEGEEGEEGGDDGASSDAEQGLDGNDDAPTAAAGALQILALDDACSNSIADAGGIPMLVQCLHRGSNFCKVVAAGALGTLAYNAENRKGIVSSGAIPALVSLLSSDASPGEEGQESSAVALFNLMTGDEARCLAADAGAVEPLVAMLQSESPEMQEAACQALGRLAKSQVCRPAIAAAGGVEALVAVLTEGGPSVREEASRAVYNLAAEPASQSAELVRAGAVQALVALVAEEAADEESQDAQRAAAQALVVLSACRGGADALLAADAIPVLVNMLAPPVAVAVQALVAQVLAESSASVAVAQAMQACYAVPALLRLLEGRNDVSQLWASKALLGLVGTPAAAEELRGGGGVALLLGLLPDGRAPGRNGQLPVAALKVLGGLCRAGEAGRQAQVLGEEGLQRVAGLLGQSEDSACASAASQILLDLVEDDAMCMSANGLLLGMLDYVCTQAAAHLPGGAEEASGLLRSLVAAPALREQVVAVGGVDPLVQALQVAASPFADAGSDDSPADPLLAAAVSALGAICTAGGAKAVLHSGGGQALVDVLLPATHEVRLSALEALAALAGDAAGLQTMLDAGARQAVLSLHGSGDEAAAAMASRVLAHLEQPGTGGGAMLNSPSATDLVEAAQRSASPPRDEGGSDAGSVEGEELAGGAGRALAFSPLREGAGATMADMVRQPSSGMVEEPQEEGPGDEGLSRPQRRVASPFVMRPVEEPCDEGEGGAPPGPHLELDKT